MAFPTIPTVAAGRLLVLNQLDTTATRTFPNFSGLTFSAGDRLVAIVIGYQSSTTDAQFGSWSHSFSEIHDTGTSTTLAIGIAEKVADGTESGTLTVTQAATITGDASMILMAIPGAHASTPIEVSARADGTTAAADPGNFTPSFGAVDTLWISVVGDGCTNAGGTWTGTGTTAPTNYNNRVDTNAADTSTIGDVEAAVAFRQLNAASEDTGTAGVDISNARNSAVVIAVPPVPAVATAPELQVSALVIEMTYVVGSNPILVDVLPAAEAEAAQSIAPLKGVAVGTATEAETANPIAPVWSISLGTATEAEVANPIDPLISREVAVGIATEVELGQTIDPQISRDVAVSTAMEVETANPIAPVWSISLGTATEVELGQPITPAISREVAVGTATERELALEITPEIAGPPTCGVDVVGWQMADGRPFAWTSWGTFGPGFVHVQECTVGPINLPIGLAVERELAQPITPTISREVAVGTAVERELANTIDPQIDREVAVGQATERELAQSITPTIGRAVLVNTATERELANGITPAISREVVIGVATEVELARFISPVKPIFVPVQTAVERELARVMTPFQGTPFIPKVVCDILTLPVACEVSSVPVACDVFSVGVDCEMVDVYGQGH